MTFRSFVYKLQLFKWRYFRLLYHHDNAPSLKAMAKLEQLRFELIAHPPYSPDLAPSDYYLFPNLKQWLQEEIHIEWGSHRGNRSVFRRLGCFVLQKGHRNVGKSLYQVYRPWRQLCWGINITLPKKTLVFIKNPGLFSPCNMYACMHIRMYEHIYVWTIRRDRWHVVDAE